MVFVDIETLVIADDGEDSFDGGEGIEMVTAFVANVFATCPLPFSSSPLIISANKSSASANLLESTSVATDGTPVVVG